MEYSLHSQSGLVADFDLLRRPRSEPFIGGSPLLRAPRRYLPLESCSLATNPISLRLLNLPYRVLIRRSIILRSRSEEGLS